MMEYNGYTGRITAVDQGQGIIHGEVAGINDVITFQGKNADELIQAFRDSVDDYITFCAERAEDPEKPYSGKFLLRISPELHRQASLAARKAGESLNGWVASAIKGRLRKAATPRQSPLRERAAVPDLREWLTLLEQGEQRWPIHGYPPEWAFYPPP